MTFFYPYVKSKFDENDPYFELKYSLRSLEKYFNGEIDIVIVGHKPDWLINVDWIPYADTMDAYSNKLNKLLLCSSVYNDFIWMHDDVFLLNNTTLEDFTTIRYNKKFDADEFTGSPLDNYLENDFKKLQEFNLTEYNYLTHLPKYIQGDKFIKCVKEMNLIKHKSVAYENLYYNYIQNEEKGIKEENQRNHIVNDIQIIKFSSNDSGIIQEDIIGKKFLNVNDKGLAKVKSYLTKEFNKKSKYEK